MNYGSLLSVRPFRNLWLGQAISQLGDSLYYLVFLFMVEKLTGDPAMVGLSGVAQTLPFLVLSLHSGVMADRVDRRFLMLSADIASTVTLILFALYVWFDPRPPAWTLMVTGALLSTINVFFAPAKSAAIPNLVPPEMLSTANGLSMATQNLMPLLGIGLSGTVLGALYALSPQYFFLAAIGLNALSFAVSAYFIRRLPSLVPERQERDITRSDLAHAWQDMKDGLGYLRGQRVLRVMLILNTLVMLAIAPFMVVYVTVNDAWFGGGYGTLALCEGAFFVGAVLSGVYVGKADIRRPGLGFIWGMATIGLTVIAMAFASFYGWFAFWNFIAGLGLTFAQITMNTYIQTVVPDAYRGRVNSALTMATMGVQPLAIGLGGILLKGVGPAVMLITMGVGMTIAALAGFFDRSFREAETPA